MDSYGVSRSTVSHVSFLLIGSLTSWAVTLLECKIWKRGFGTTLSEMKGSLWNLSSRVTSRWKTALTAASFENGWRIDYSYQDVTLWWLKVQLAIASSHWRALALGIICCFPLNLKVWSARWTVITHNGHCLKWNMLCYWDYIYI